MNLLPDSQQTEIISVVRNFLADEVPARRYQSVDLKGNPYDAALWSQFVELGWFSLRLDEKNGGSNLGLIDEAFLYREAGRQLLSPTLLGTSMAVTVASDLGDRALVTALTTGQSRAATALPLRNFAANDDHNVMIFDGNDADYIFVCDGADCQVAGLGAVTEVNTLNPLDESLSMTKAQYNSRSAVAHTKDQTVALSYSVLLAAQLVGIAEATLEMAVSYAKEREQFGKPIGSFQAIKHICADMAVRAEVAWAQTVYCALMIDEDYADAHANVAAAALVACEAATLNSSNNIQVHGGMGFAAECNAHFYLKRAHVYAEFVGACAPSPARLLVGEPKRKAT